MKATVYHSPGKISLDDVPTPKLEYANNAIVRVTASSICGSDIHVIGGHLGVPTPVQMGHEFVGVVEEVGSDVEDFKPGDRVAVSCVASCGVCEPCKDGQPVHCTKHNVGCFGVSPLLPGCQSEYVRIPFADNTLYHIPDSLTDEDVLFVGDILSTGYFGAEMAEIKMGDTVLIVGAGPVGMCAAASARLFSPAKIIIVDSVESRLETCLREGIVDEVINFMETDVQERVKELTGGKGVDRAIEAIGKEASMLTCMEAVRFGGNVSFLGVFSGPVQVPLHQLWNKNLTIRTGFVPVNRIDELIRMIEMGKINTNFLITHRSPLNDVVKAYDYFGNKKDNCIKWVLTEYEAQEQEQPDPQAVAV